MMEFVFDRIILATTFTPFPARPEPEEAQQADGSGTIHYSTPTSHFKINMASGEGAIPFSQEARLQKKIPN
jgi:hypothetical protein